MDGFEYEIAMRDSLGAPARAGAASLDKLKGSIKGVDHALKSAHGGAHTFASGVSYAVRGFDDLARGGRYAANGVLDVGKAFARLGPTLVGAAVVGATVAIGKAAFAMGEFREQTELAYEASGKDGKKTFAAIDATARAVHMPAEKAHELARDLMLQGLESQKTIQDTIAAVSDLQRVGLEKGADKIRSIIDRSLATGHFTLGKGGRALAGTGADEKALAAQLGLPSVAALESQMRAGRISVEQGVEALDNVILHGKVGALATKKFTVTDALTDMKNALRGVLQQTDTGPVTDAFKRMSESFAEGSDGAKALKDDLDALMTLAGALVDGVGALSSTLVGIGEFGAKAFHKIRDAAQSALDLIRGGAHLLSGFQSQADKEYSSQAERDIDKRTDKELRQRIEKAKIDKALDLQKTPGLTPAQVHAGGKAIGVDLYAAGQEEAAGKDAKDEAAMRRALKGATGSASVVPLSGVQKPGDRLVDAGSDAGAGFEKGVRDKLKMHSPSEVMFDAGQDAGAGLESGTRSAMRSFEPSSAAPITSAGTPVGSDGKSLSVAVHVGGIHFQGQIDHDDIVPLLESQVADVFERAALELGQ